MTTTRITNRRAHYFLLVACVLGMLLSGTALAQESSARPDRGVLPSGSYSVSDIENINLTNGNLQLSIPLASLPPIAGGRLSWTVRATYNSKLWNVRGTQDPHGFFVMDPALNSGQGGWEVGSIYSLDFRNARDDMEYIIPNAPPGCEGAESVQECVLLQNSWHKVVFRTPDGSEHELRPLDYADYSSPYNNGTRPYLRGYYKETPDKIGAPMRYYSSDGSYLWAVVYPSTNGTFWVVYLPDGTKITQYNSSTGGRQVIEDTNGNSISIFTDSEGRHYRDDRTNREILLVTDGSKPVQVQYKTVGGVTQHIDINWGTTQVIGKLYFVKQWKSIFDPDGIDKGFACNVHKRMGSHTMSVIRGIVFPETEPGVESPRYSFKYNSDETEAFSKQINESCNGQSVTYEADASKGLGSLSQITTPTGATVDYQYTTGFNSALSPHFFADVNAIPREKIKTKKITHDGGIQDTWTYGIEDGEVLVTKPDGSTVRQNFEPYDSAVARAIGGTGYEGLVFSVNQSNKAITYKHWTRMLFSNNQSGANYNNITVFNPVVDAEYTALLEPDANGNPQPVKMSAKTFKYDYNGNLLETREYDWFDPSLVTYGWRGVPTGVPASATLLRVTNNKYYNSATDTAGVADPNSPNVYAKRSLNFTATNPSLLILNAVQKNNIGNSETRFSYDGQDYGTAPTVGNLTKVSSFDDQGDTNLGNDRWLNTVIAYDTYGNKTSGTDPNGHVTLFEYESLAAYGLPKYVKVNPLNGTGEQTTTTEYDLTTGMVTKQTDANGNFIEIGYTNQLTGQPDPFGRPGVTYSPAVLVNGTSQRRKVITTYEDHLRRVTVASDLNAEGDGLLKSRTTKDKLGRTILVEQSEDGSTFSLSSQTIYEQGGRVIYQSNLRRGADASTDGWTRSIKDEAGRVIDVATFAGASRPSSGTACAAANNCTGQGRADYYANQTTHTDQAGKVRKNIVDASGRLIKVFEDPQNLNYETTYTYDVMDNLTGVIQNSPQGNQTRSFTYSTLSRLRSAYNPESGTIQYECDGNGNLITRTDARGIVTTYVFDGLNRLKSQTYSDTTPAVIYTYDTLPNGKGRLASISSNISTISYAGYDAYGHVTGSTQVTNGHTYTMPEYKYNLAGSLISQKYPSGRVVYTDYDNAGRISGLNGQKTGEPNKTYTSSFSYTAHGAVASAKLGNDLWAHTSFNSRLQPVEIGLGTSSTDSSKLKLDYTYGVLVNNVLDVSKNNGNPESQTITGAGLSLTQSYTYDQLNRLKTFNENGGLSQTYDYDRWGNRALTAGYKDPLAKIPTPQSLGDFKSNNRIRGYDDSQGYDAAGNLNQIVGRSYAFDAENRMTAHDDAQTIGVIDDRYAYDGEGRRVKKVNGNVTTIFVYNIYGQMIAEYTDYNTSPTSGTSYFTSDILGTTRIITNQQKAVVSRHDYLPFGEEIKANTNGRTAEQGYVDDADGVRQKFTQKERDEETGLDYFGARYYSSSQGRFTSPDEPFMDQEIEDPQSWNLYAYVRNNPLAYIDPTGEGRWEVGEDGIEHYVGDIGEYDPELNADWDGVKWNFRDNNGQDNTVTAEPEDNNVMAASTLVMVWNFSPPPIKIGSVAIAAAAGVGLGIGYLNAGGTVVEAPYMGKAVNLARPATPPVKPVKRKVPPFYFNKREKRFIKHIADKYADYGLDYDTLSEALHAEKESLGMRGKAVEKEFVEDVARELVGLPPKNEGKDTPEQR